MTPSASRFPPPATPRGGVLLINLGTPDAPTPEAIRRYLREFLSDRRVVDLPRALWWPILHGFILPLRPRKLAHPYAQIWTAAGSPLLTYSQTLARAVGEQLPGIPVALGMRYGWPSVATALKELELRKPARLLILPLYPQYSRTTTASALDAVEAAMHQRPWQPELRIIADYHSDAGYLAALRDSVLRHWQQQGRGERLLISFHGIPERYVKARDPYPAQCQRSATRLAALLDLPESAWQLSFQSRIGRAPWTGPYTDEVLLELARGGVKTVDVICPGFAVDCL
ncbi:MAG: ferrochelatase, partial [Hydrocarboniphaga effusa]|nr:ferrochelatase [Hydrocarboniphaga effusa]